MEDSREGIDFIDRPAGSTSSTLSTLSNPQVNLVNPVNLVQNRPAGSTLSILSALSKTPAGAILSTRRTERDNPGRDFIDSIDLASTGTATKREGAGIRATNETSVTPPRFHCFGGHRDSLAPVLAVLPVLPEMHSRWPPTSDNQNVIQSTSGFETLPGS